MASQATGKSRAYNLLRSLDVISTLISLKKLGIKVRLKKKYCEIESRGLNTFYENKKITLDAGNSGTLGRLILGLLIHSKNKIKIIGDKSLSKRDFSRVILPLKKFGAKFKYRSNYKLPIEIYGVKKLNQLDIMKLEDQHNVKVQSCWSLKYTRQDNY